MPALLQLIMTYLIMSWFITILWGYSFYGRTITSTITATVDAATMNITTTTITTTITTILIIILSYLIGVLQLLQGVLQGVLHYIIIIAIISIINTLIIWVHDITVEASLYGYHTNIVKIGLNIAFILFIISEIALFGSIFWGYLNTALPPSIDIGNVWPPITISPVSPLHIPIIATALLFTSSITITVSHYAHIGRYRHIAINYLIITIIKALYFSLFQLYEYYINIITISDSIYANIFYISTGLHGTHIIIGTIYLLVELYITLSYINTDKTHTGYKLSIIYWHFVDILWGFIYTLLYIWPYTNNQL